MQPQDLLGKTFACVCGRTHSVPLREVIYAESAAARLPAVLRRLLPGKSKVALLADQRTFEAAGNAAEHHLSNAGFSVSCLLVPDAAQGEPVCDDVTFNVLSARLPATDLLLAVGAGVINDLTKWLASEKQLPYVTFATAASMNGYASSNIAPTIGGVKRLVEGVAPWAVLADPAVLSAAPYELTAAGLGDVIAKPVSTTDWRINQVLFGDYYCPLCAQLIRELEPTYRRAPQRLVARDPEVLAALFYALVYSGVAMTVAGTSFPASGGEHLVSHALDMMAMERGIRHDYHGRQVGVGTVFAAALYARLLEMPSPNFQARCEPTDRACWGKLADAVEIEHARKRQRMEIAAAALRRPGVWLEIRRIIQENYTPPQEIKQCLAAAGAAHRLNDIGCGKAHFLEAAIHCHQLRERFTVIDLARAAGVLPDAASAIVDEFLID